MFIQLVLFLCADFTWKNLFLVMDYSFYGKAYFLLNTSIKHVNVSSIRKAVFQLLLLHLFQTFKEILRKHKCLSFRSIFAKIYALALVLCVQKYFTLSVSLYYACNSRFKQNRTFCFFWYCTSTNKLHLPLVFVGRDLQFLRKQQAK